MSVLYEAGQILVRKDEPEGVRITVRLEPTAANRLHKRLEQYFCVEAEPSSDR